MKKHNENSENFKQAANIARGIGNGLRRRASAGEFEPFYGANFDRQPMVIWKAEEHHLTSFSSYGTIQFGKEPNVEIYYFKKV